MKRLAIPVSVALVVGYVVGIVSLFIWAGRHLLEDFGDYLSDDD